MKKILFLFLLQIILEVSTFAQNQTDSLIHFSEIKYHSDFEKQAIYNFVNYKSDTFNLFLAIDENMTNEEMIWRKKIYLDIFEGLKEKSIDNKKINKKIGSI